MIDLPNLQSALLHTLWQGPLIALLLLAVLALLPARRPNARYAVATMALVVFVLTFFVTWSLPAAHTPDGGMQYIVSETVGPGQSAKAVWPAVPTITVGSARERPAAPGFSALLLPLWMAGALCMLLRLLWLLKATRALAHTARQPVASPLLETFETLCRALKVPARTALRISASVATPVALGLLHPLVILPAAYVTTLAPEHLRAILAHELAHIRRHDYLINLLQLLAEAAFYFNPALWWINRQIRLEREACCDHLAAQYAGGPLGYAAALASIARHSPALAPPRPALAMNGPAPTPGPLLDRIHRLLLPAHRPHLRLPWYSLAATLALTLLCLLATYTTTQAATRILTTYLQMDNEARIEYLKEMDPPRYPEDALKAMRDMVEVSGRLILPEGHELDDRKGRLAISTRAPFLHSGSASYNKRGDFSGTAPRARVYIHGVIPGYAPILAGPFEASNTKVLDDIEIPITIAEHARILLRDDVGNPVPNANIAIFYRFFENSSEGILPRVTKEDGLIVLEQSTPPIPLDLRVNAPGFQSARFDQLLAPAGADTVLRMAVSVPAEVILRNESTKAPVDKATFQLLRSGNLQLDSEESLPVEALGDGRFRLHELDRSTESLVLARAPELGGAVFSLEPMADDEPLTIDIPEVYLHGTIQGNLEGLRNSEGQLQLLAAAYLVELNGIPTGFFSLDEILPVTVEDGRGHFTLGGLPKCTVMLSVGQKMLEIPLTGPVTDHVIQLDEMEPEANCTLKLSLTTPPGVPPVNGTVMIHFREARNVFQGRDVQARIVDGIGTARVPSGVTLSIALNGLPGFGFEPGQNGQSPMHLNHAVPEEAQRAEITAQLVATGAITGAAITENGVPLHHSWVRVSKQVEGKEESQSVDSMTIDATGAFAFRGLPLDNTYTVAVDYRGQEYAQTVTLTPAQPVANLQITPPPIPDQRSIRVAALQPGGNALREFRALLVLDDAPNRPLEGTTASGVLQLPLADAGVAGKVIVIPNADFQPATVRVSPATTEISVPVTPGRRAQGRVLYRGTGKPAPGIQVHVQASLVVYLQATSNHEGFFTFSNLPDEPVSLAAYEFPRRAYVSLEPQQPLHADGSTVLQVDPIQNAGQDSAP